MRKKILFVTHALESPYGAATSLRTLLHHYTDVDADVIVPRSFRRLRDLTALSSHFPGIRRIHEFSIPVDLGAVGMKRNFAEKLHGMAHSLSWWLDRHRYKELLAANKYDLVHLNSVVLHKMMLPDTPAVAHVREIIPDTSALVIEKLAKNASLIFIDTTTRKPFAAYEDRMHATTLNNPIDMRRAEHCAETIDHPQMNPATTVFSMIGRISALKGVNLVIEAFCSGAGPDAALLIVGDGPPDYVAHCRQIAAADRRVIFFGEEDNVAKVYAATDYVVRGDPQPCVGRTVYEGLYSGCSIIMPGPGSPDMIFEADRFQDAIFWYAPGSKSALADVFGRCSGKKIGERRFLSNVEAYVQAFDAFMDSCLNRTSRTK